MEASHESFIMDPVKSHTMVDDIVHDPAPESSASSDPQEEEEEDRHQKDQMYYQELFDKHIKVSQKPVCHDKTAVLLLSWDPKLDDLGVQKEVKNLGEVFQKAYNFTISSSHIKGHNPQASVNRLLSEFVDDHGHEHSLLIVYYAGHGWSDEHGQFKIGPRRRNKILVRDDIVWKQAEEILKPALSDVLVIFDCCEAGALAHQSRSPHRTFEYLGACKEGQTTRKPGDRSFTSALILALKELATRATFSTLELLDKILEAPEFPKFEQEPVLFVRDAPTRKHIDIQPLTKDALTKECKMPMAEPEFRDGANEYLDIRLEFNRRLGPDDIVKSTTHLSKLIDNSDIPVKTICLKRKSSLVADYAYHWRRTVKRKTLNGASRRSPLVTPGLLAPTMVKDEDYLSESPAQIGPAHFLSNNNAAQQEEQSVLQLAIPRTQEVLRPMEPRADDRTRGDGGVFYHSRMVVVRTAENCQSGLGWVRDKTKSRPVVTLGF
ncbi:uncharacterized protein BDZ99DRAFT_500500 [Mytilinidion resinicola]|uniref:Peptidase C14 caspase domain-containing protein n=1 Tax=Mytilinidion resinicola TaxID=574789 RepID=A0A6A6YEK2_9PEZI|nr:uncharacterized protein BDZ99DRAFT_500500 [Mytilinidion resinicola]KAF2807252.1 hypothetical protein BDZ99DRAFT_500500 [Mytilinidion resinicola]